MAKRVMDALIGPVAAGFGLAAAHLVAALTTPSASPVLAVGSMVIDRTPTPVKEWAIARFGTYDKPILVGSVLLVVLAVTVAVGPLSRRRLGYGVGLLGGLALVAALCAQRGAGPTFGNLAPAVVAGVLAVGALVLLLRLGAPRRAEGEADTTTSRRGVLIGLGILTAASVALAGGGRWVGRRLARQEAVDLPLPAEPAPALPAGLDRTVPGVTRFRTPVEDFYRVDTRLDVPVVASATWSLTIDGDVERPYTVDYDELLAMPMIERDITLTCVSNSVGGPYAGGARWLGVRLTDLLDRAGVRGGADQLLSTDFDGMTISTPLALASDGRDAMLAVGMNGVPLPREHGFPARLVIPGLYGFISATKWVTRLTVTSYADRSAYWTERGWATEAPIKISSRIDTPRPLAELDRGEVVIGGVAWAQSQGGVATVEVRIDGGPWQPADLGPSGGNDYWRQWFFRWPADRGAHTLATRVFDGAGRPQAPVRAEPFPDGASGIHTINVTVV